jgi:excisionase family DNA binding protein
MQQKMTDRVLICLPDGRWLALSADLFREALQSGAERAAPSATSPAQQPSSGLVTADEIGEATHMSRSTVYELAKAGVLPSVRVGRRIRFDRERVMSVLASRSTATLPQLTGRTDHGVHS